MPQNKREKKSKRKKATEKPKLLFSREALDFCRQALEGYNLRIIDHPGSTPNEPLVLKTIPQVLEIIDKAVKNPQESVEIDETQNVVLRAAIAEQALFLLRLEGTERQLALSRQIEILLSESFLAN